MKRQAFILALLTAVACSLGACGGSAQASSSAPAEGASASIEEAASSEASSSAPEEKLDAANAGRIDGTVYTNSALCFSYTFPENWKLYTPEETLSIQMEEAAALYGSTAELETAIRQGRMQYLLHAATIEEKENAPAGSLLVQTAPAEALQGATPGAYAETLAEQIKSGYTKLGAELTVSPVETKEIEGNEVAFIDCKILLNGEINGTTFQNYQVTQGYSVFLANDTAVIALFSAFSDDQLAACTQVLHDISFTR